MKKIIQATLLLLVAAMAVLAAASTYPARNAKRQIQSAKSKQACTPDLSGCTHTTDLFMYESGITSVINH